MRQRHLNWLVLVLLAVATACSTGAGDGESTAVANRASSPGTAPITLRLGYLPNVTHAQALVGLARGTFVQALLPYARLERKSFNAGPSAMEALLAGEIDATYVGPNPAINGYVRSEGKAVRIVAGAASGGAMFVVRPDRGIDRPQDLAGKRLATPQIGNTQDVALRTYLLANGLAPREMGGNVTIIPAQNPDILTLFKRGDIDGAWVPEPWATRLVREAGGRIFVDEHDLWPDGRFATTVLVVRTDFLQKHPAAVEALLRAHLEATEWIGAHPEEAKGLVNEAIRQATGVALTADVVDAAWQHLVFTYDPIVSSLYKMAGDAHRLGFLQTGPDLRGIFALDILNRQLREKGLPEVTP